MIRIWCCFGGVARAYISVRCCHGYIIVLPDSDNRLRCYCSGIEANRSAIHSYCKSGLNGIRMHDAQCTGLGSCGGHSGVQQVKGTMHTARIVTYTWLLDHQRRQRGLQTNDVIDWVRLLYLPPHKTWYWLKGLEMWSTVPCLYRIWISKQYLYIDQQPAQSGVVRSRSAAVTTSMPVSSMTTSTNELSRQHDGP